MPEGVSLELVSENLSVFCGIVKAIDMTRGANDMPGDTVNGRNDKGP